MEHNLVEKEMEHEKNVIEYIQTHLIQRTDAHLSIIDAKSKYILTYYKSNYLKLLQLFEDKSNINEITKSVMDECYRDNSFQCVFFNKEKFYIIYINKFGSKDVKVISLDEFRVSILPHFIATLALFYSEIRSVVESCKNMHSLSTEEIEVNYKKYNDLIAIERAHKLFDADDIFEYSKKMFNLCLETEIEKN